MNEEKEPIQLNSNIVRVHRDMSRKRVEELLSDTKCYGIIILGLKDDGTFDLVIEESVYDRTFHAIGCLSYTKSIIEEVTRGINSDD